MNIHQNTSDRMEWKINAGGTDYVPPAPCPRSAHASAYPAAHVERTGRSGANENMCEGSGRPARKIGLISGGGLA